VSAEDASKAARNALSAMPRTASKRISTEIIPTQSHNASAQPY
jgi:hypothetical protein